MKTTHQKRKEAILSRIYQEGSADVASLSEDLGVSEATVRRDLRGLAREGLLQVTHGGAAVSRTSDYSFRCKAMRNVEAKKMIGLLAGELVADGDQIFVDSGTTCFQMAGALRGKKGLSVIVNSIRTAQELYTPGLNVLLLGGQYRPDRMDAVGPMAAASLERLRGYRAFFGSDGLGMEFGPSAIDIDSASLFGQAVQNAREAVLLADSTKFRSPALYRIVGWGHVHKIVTDTRPDDAWMAFLQQQGIEVIHAEKRGS